MATPDDLLLAAHEARRALCAAMVDDPPPVFVRLSAAAQRAQDCDARVRRLIAIGEAVEAATIGPGGGETRIGDVYVWSAAEMLAVLKDIGGRL